MKASLDARSFVSILSTCAVLLLTAGCGSDEKPSTSSEAGGAGGTELPDAGLTPSDCQGAAFCNGACLATVGEAAAGCELLYDAAASHLVVDDALYYSSGFATVGRIDLSSFADTVLVQPTLASYGLDVDSTYVYYASVPESEARIDRMPKIGGSAELVVSGIGAGEGIDGLRLIGSDIYYRAIGTFGPGQLIRVSGGNSAPVLGGVNILGYTADDTHVYFVQEDDLLATSIARAPLTALDSTEVLAPGQGSVDSVGLAGDHVYWVSGTSLLGVPKAGGDVETVLSFTGTSRVVHQDETGIYVWERNSDEDQLLRVAPGGSEAVPIARIEHALDPPPVASDANHIYFSRAYGVLRVAK